MRRDSGLRYRVETKSGKIYKAAAVEIAMGFITMKFWHGEIRLPAGEILSVKKTYLPSKSPPPEKTTDSASGSLVIPIVLFIIVFIFALPKF